MKSKSSNTAPSDASSLSPLIIVGGIIVLGTLALFLIFNFLNIEKVPSEKNAEGVASNSTIEQGNKEREEYPILEYLPIQNAVYTIGYQFDDDGVPTIIVDTTEYYLKFALEKLTSLGTPDRPANSYRLQIQNWTGGDEEEEALKRFQGQE